jgi:hypothetical protein
MAMPLARPVDKRVRPRPSSSGRIFWRKDGFEDEDEGRAREHLAEERFMGEGHSSSFESDFEIGRLKSQVPNLRH